MTRRPIGLLIPLALGLLVAPLAAAVQPLAKIPRIGYLTDSVRRASADTLRHALRELGYVEGQHIAFEVRLAEQPEQYPALAAELVGLQVDILVVRSGRMVRAAQQATRTIPIVMAASDDAVGQGYVASLARPGGNVTGLTSMSPDLSQKSLELLKESLPGIARVAVFRCASGARQPLSVGQREWEQLHVTGQRLGLHLQSLEVEGLDHFETLFAAAVRERADALLTLNCRYTNLASKQVAALAAKHRLPGAYYARDAVEAGGLMSYGPSQPEMHYRAAYYVDRLLKGTPPTDLPVEQPTTFELVLNLKTAQARCLGPVLGNCLHHTCNLAIHQSH